MPPRETTEITIDKYTFVVKTYATAREMAAIQQAYFRGAKIEVVGQEPRISEFNPAVQTEVHKEMIAQLVVSVNGVTENVVDYCIDLPNDIFMELIGRVDDMATKKKS